MKFVNGLMLALALVAHCALADDGLSWTQETVKVVRAPDGKETFVSADQAKLNDIVECRTVYRNTTPQPLERASATMPIPPGFEYVPNTGTAKALASTDGKIFAPVPLVRLVSSPEGKRATEHVPPAEYRYLRWHLDLPVGASSTVVARMKMSATQ